jgi:hypothetical protein
MDDMLHNDNIYGTPHPTPLRLPVTSKYITVYCLQEFHQHGRYAEQ